LAVACVESSGLRVGETGIGLSDNPNPNPNHSTQCEAKHDFDTDLPMAIGDEVLPREGDDIITAGDSVDDADSSWALGWERQTVTIFNVLCMV
jgi:hypothetical protein